MAINSGGVRVSKALVVLPDLAPLLAGATADAAECSTLYRALGEVAVSGCAPSDPVERVATADRSLALQRDLRDYVITARSNLFARVQHVLAQARLQCSAAELLSKATELLCSACGLDRAVLSRVDGSTWVPGQVYATSGERAEPPAELRVLLRGGLLEAEVVRRRLAILVRADVPERLDAGFVEWFGSGSYVVAPLVLSDQVVGLLHADRPGGRLSSMHRDAVATFASELARTYEHMVLAERFAQQRARVRAALVAAHDEYVPPTDAGAAGVRLARRGTTVTVATELPMLMGESRLDGLSEREIEVLRLMAEGATNLQVAVRLVVSESTVKSHVKQILRKLAAANRAEAVYVYLSQAVAG